MYLVNTNATYLAVVGDTGLGGGGPCLRAVIRLVLKVAAYGRKNVRESMCTSWSFITRNFFLITNYTADKISLYAGD